MLQQRQLGDLTVSEIGLGCVGMSAEYGAAHERNESASLNTLERAFERGITFYDTADCYGPFTNEVLLSKFLGDKREDVVISTKAGLVRETGTDTYVINARPEHLKTACTESLQRLNIEVVDIYFLHRVDPCVPIEDSWGALLELQQEGHVKHLGICEATREQLDVVHRMGAVTAVQSEFSLWTRDAEEEIIPWCEANGAGFVPFAPLGRGFLTGTIASADFDDDDIRSTNPRFAREAIAANQAIVEGIRTVATNHGATPAQIAIAWILAQGESIVPIPGTKQVAYMEENVGAATIDLTQTDLALLEALPPTVGSRY
ncbi:aldo/keto reductase [Homoserinimonas sp. OAct 916]|uniref:aldo/keto reductase n=1 Tax=Homoserinimonas sp. OAct 916 TaxID=2211450 RepID=UPI000DBE077E|nr:aldo/keto reductase [Homoserinimonas sp. OAct 916]